MDATVTTDATRSEAMPPGPPVVLLVAEGPRPRLAGTRSSRLFSVVLDRPPDDWGIVATAQAPEPKPDPAVAALAPAEIKPRTAIPLPGTGHPDDPDWVSEAPILFEVGFRAEGGAMLAIRSRFFNVRVPYLPRAKSRGEA